MNDSKITFDPVVLPTHYVQQVILQAKNMTNARKKVMQLVDFDLDLAEEMISFTPQQFYQFILSLKKLAGNNLGLLVGRRLLANTHGSLGSVAMSCGSIRQFADVFADFLPLRTDLASISSYEKGKRLRMELHATQPLGEIERVVLEAIMVAIKNVLDYITIGEERKVDVAFTFPEGKNALLTQHIFSCKVSYAQKWTGFSFPLSEVDKPLVITDKTAFEQAADLCRQELAQMDERLPVHKKIEYLISKQEGELFTFDQIASILNLPERTLHRKLEKENMQFKGILDKVKYKKAMEYLDAGLTMKEAGVLLGYQYSSNFSRAMTRWKTRANEG